MVLKRRRHEASVRFASVKTSGNAGHQPYTSVLKSPSRKLLAENENWIYYFTLLQFNNFWKIHIKTREMWNYQGTVRNGCWQEYHPPPKPCLGFLIFFVFSLQNIRDKIISRFFAWDCWKTRLHLKNLRQGFEGRRVRTVLEMTHEWHTTVKCILRAQY